MYKNATSDSYEDDPLESHDFTNTGLDSDDNIIDPMAFMKYHMVNDVDPSKAILPKGMKSDDLKGLDPKEILTDFGSRTELSPEDVQLLQLLQSAQVEQKRLTESDRRAKARGDKARERSQILPMDSKGNLQLRAKDGDVITEDDANEVFNTVAKMIPGFEDDMKNFFAKDLMSGKLDRDGRPVLGGMEFDANDMGDLSMLIEASKNEQNFNQNGQNNGQKVPNNFPLPQDPSHPLNHPLLQSKSLQQLEHEKKMAQRTRFDVQLEQYHDAFNKDPFLVQNTVLSQLESITPGALSRLNPNTIGHPLSTAGVDLSSYGPEERDVMEKLDILRAQLQKEIILAKKQNNTWLIARQADLLQKQQNALLGKFTRSDREEIMKMLTPQDVNINPIRMEPALWAEERRLFFELYNIDRILVKSFEDGQWWSKFLTARQKGELEGTGVDPMSHLSDDDILAKLKNYETHILRLRQTKQLFIIQHQAELTKVNEILEKRKEYAEQQEIFLRKEGLIEQAEQEQQDALLDYFGKKKRLSLLQQQHQQLQYELNSKSTMASFFNLDDLERSDYQRRLIRQSLERGQLLDKKTLSAILATTPPKYHSNTTATTSPHHNSDFSPNPSTILSTSPNNPSGTSPTPIQAQYDSPYKQMTPEKAYSDYENPPPLDEDNPNSRFDEILATRPTLRSKPLLPLIDPETLQVNEIPSVYPELDKEGHIGVGQYWKEVGSIKEQLAQHQKAQSSQPSNETVFGTQDFSVIGALYNGKGNPALFSGGSEVPRTLDNFFNPREPSPFLSSSSHPSSRIHSSLSSPSSHAFSHPPLDPDQYQPSSRPHPLNLELREAEDSAESDGLGGFPAEILGLYDDSTINPSQLDPWEIDTRNSGPDLWSELFDQKDFIHDSILEQFASQQRIEELHKESMLYQFYRFVDQRRQDEVASTVIDPDEDKLLQSQAIIDVNAHDPYINSNNNNNKNKNNQLIVQNNDATKTFFPEYRSTEVSSPQDYPHQYLSFKYDYFLPVYDTMNEKLNFYDWSKLTPQPTPALRPIRTTVNQWSPINAPPFITPNLIKPTFPPGTQPSPENLHKAYLFMWDQIRVIAKQRRDYNAIHFPHYKPSGNYEDYSNKTNNDNNINDNPTFNPPPSNQIEFYQTHPIYATYLSLFNDINQNNAKTVELIQDYNNYMLNSNLYSTCHTPSQTLPSLFKLFLRDRSFEDITKLTPYGYDIDEHEFLLDPVLFQYFPKESKDLLNVPSAATTSSFSRLYTTHGDIDLEHISAKDDINQIGYYTGEFEVPNFNQYLSILQFDSIYHPPFPESNHEIKLFHKIFGEGLFFSYSSRHELETVVNKHLFATNQHIRDRMRAREREKKIQHYKTGESDLVKYHVITRSQSSASVLPHLPDIQDYHYFFYPQHRLMFNTFQGYYLDKVKKAQAEQKRDYYHQMDQFLKVWNTRRFQWRRSHPYNSSTGQNQTIPLLNYEPLPVMEPLVTKIDEKKLDFDEMMAQCEAKSHSVVTKLLSHSRFLSNVDNLYDSGIHIPLAHPEMVLSGYRAKAEVMMPYYDDLLHPPLNPLDIVIAPPKRQYTQPASSIDVPYYEDVWEVVREEREIEEGNADENNTTNNNNNNSNNLNAPKLLQNDDEFVDSSNITPDGHYHPYDEDIDDDHDDGDDDDPDGRDPRDSLYSKQRLRAQRRIERYFTHRNVPAYQELLPSEMEQTNVFISSKKVVGGGKGDLKSVQEGALTPPPPDPSKSLIDVDVSPIDDGFGPKAAPGEDVVVIAIDLKDVGDNVETGKAEKADKSQNDTTNDSNNNQGGFFATVFGGFFGGSKPDTVSPPPTPTPTTANNNNDENNNNQVTLNDINSTIDTITPVTPSSTQQQLLNSNKFDSIIDLQAKLPESLSLDNPFDDVSSSDSDTTDGASDIEYQQELDDYYHGNDEFNTIYNKSDRKLLTGPNDDDQSNDQNGQNEKVEENVENVQNVQNDENQQNEASEEPLDPAVLHLLSKYNPDALSPSSIPRQSNPKGSRKQQKRRKMELVRKQVGILRYQLSFHPLSNAPASAKVPLLNVDHIYHPQHVKKSSDFCGINVSGSRGAVVAPYGGPRDFHFPLFMKAILQYQYGFENELLQHRFVNLFLSYYRHRVNAFVPLDWFTVYTAPHVPMEERSIPSRLALFLKSFDPLKVKKGEIINSPILNPPSPNPSPTPPTPPKRSRALGPDGNVADLAKEMLLGQDGDRAGLSRGVWDKDVYPRTFLAQSARLELLSRSFDNDLMRYPAKIPPRYILSQAYRFEQELKERAEKKRELYSLKEVSQFLDEKLSLLVPEKILYTNIDSSPVSDQDRIIFDMIKADAQGQDISLVGGFGVDEDRVIMKGTDGLGKALNEKERFEQFEKDFIEKNIVKDHLMNVIQLDKKLAEAQQKLAMFANGDFDGFDDDGDDNDGDNDDNSHQHFNTKLQQQKAKQHQAQLDELDLLRQSIDFTIQLQQFSLEKSLLESGVIKPVDGSAEHHIAKINSLQDGLLLKKHQLEVKLGTPLPNFESLGIKTPTIPSVPRDLYDVVGHNEVDRHYDPNNIKNNAGSDDENDQNDQNDINKNNLNLISQSQVESTIQQATAFLTNVAVFLQGKTPVVSLTLPSESAMKEETSKTAPETAENAKKSPTPFQSASDLLKSLADEATSKNHLSSLESLLTGVNGAKFTYNYGNFGDFLHQQDLLSRKRQLLLAIVGDSDKVSQLSPYQRKRLGLGGEGDVPPEFLNPNPWVHLRTGDTYLSTPKLPPQPPQDPTDLRYALTMDRFTGVPIDVYQLTKFGELDLFDDGSDLNLSQKLDKIRPEMDLYLERLHYFLPKMGWRKNVDGGKNNNNNLGKLTNPKAAQMTLLGSKSTLPPYFEFNVFNEPLSARIVAQLTPQQLISTYNILVKQRKKSFLNETQISRLKKEFEDNKTLVLLRYQERLMNSTDLSRRDLKIRDAVEKGEIELEAVLGEMKFTPPPHIKSAPLPQPMVLHPSQSDIYNAKININMEHYEQQMLLKYDYKGQVRPSEMVREMLKGQDIGHFAWFYEQDRHRNGYNNNLPTVTDGDFDDALFGARKDQTNNKNSQNDANRSVANNADYYTLDGYYIDTSSLSPSQRLQYDLDQSDLRRDIELSPEELTQRYDRKRSLLERKREILMHKNALLELDRSPMFSPTFPLSTYYLYSTPLNHFNASSEQDIYGREESDDGSDGRNKNSTLDPKGAKNTKNAKNGQKSSNNDSYDPNLTPRENELKTKALQLKKKVTNITEAQKALFSDEQRTRLGLDDDQKDDKTIIRQFIDEKIPAMGQFLDFLSPDGGKNDPNVQNDQNGQKVRNDEDELDAFDLELLNATNSTEIDLIDDAVAALSSRPPLVTMRLSSIPSYDYYNPIYCGDLIEEELRWRDDKKHAHLKPYHDRQLQQYILTKNGQVVRNQGRAFQPFTIPHHHLVKLIQDNAQMSENFNLSDDFPMFPIRDRMASLGYVETDHLHPVDLNPWVTLSPSLAKRFESDRKFLEEEFCINTSLLHPIEISDTLDFFSRHSHNLDECQGYVDRLKVLVEVRREEYQSIYGPLPPKLSRNPPKGRSTKDLPVLTHVLQLESMIGYDEAREREKWETVNNYRVEKWLYDQWKEETEQGEKSNGDLLKNDKNQKNQTNNFDGPNPEQQSILNRMFNWGKGTGPMKRVEILDWDSYKHKKTKELIKEQLKKGENGQKGQNQGDYDEFNDFSDFEDFGGDFDVQKDSLWDQKVDQIALDRLAVLTTPLLSSEEYNRIVQDYELNVIRKNNSRELTGEEIEILSRNDKEFAPFSSLRDPSQRSNPYPDYSLPRINPKTGRRDQERVPPEVISRIEKIEKEGIPPHYDHLFLSSSEKNSYSQSLYPNEEIEAMSDPVWLPPYVTPQSNMRGPDVSNVNYSFIKEEPHSYPPRPQDQYLREPPPKARGFLLQPDGKISIVAEDPAAQPILRYRDIRDRFFPNVQHPRYQEAVSRSFLAKLEIFPPRLPNGDPYIGIIPGEDGTSLFMPDYIDAGVLERGEWPPLEYRNDHFIEDIDRHLELLLFRPTTHPDGFFMEEIKTVGDYNKIKYGKHAQLLKHFTPQQLQAFFYDKNDLSIAKKTMREDYTLSRGRYSISATNERMWTEHEAKYGSFDYNISDSVWERTSFIDPEDAIEAVEKYDQEHPESSSWDYFLEDLLTSPKYRFMPLHEQRMMLRKIRREFRAREDGWDGSVNDDGKFIFSPKNPSDLDSRYNNPMDFDIVRDERLTEEDKARMVMAKDANGANDNSNTSENALSRQNAHNYHKISSESNRDTIFKSIDPYNYFGLRQETIDGMRNDAGELTEYDFTRYTVATDEIAQEIYDEDPSFLSPEEIARFRIVPLSRTPQRHALPIVYSASHPDDLDEVLDYMYGGGIVHDKYEKDFRLLAKCYREFYETHSFDPETQEPIFIDDTIDDWFDEELHFFPPTNARLIIVGALSLASRTTTSVSRKVELLDNYGMWSPNYSNHTDPNAVGYPYADLPAFPSFLGTFKPRSSPSSSQDKSSSFSSSPSEKASGLIASVKNATQRAFGGDYTDSEDDGEGYTDDEGIDADYVDGGLEPLPLEMEFAQRYIQTVRNLSKMEQFQDLLEERRRVAREVRGDVLSQDPNQLNPTPDSLSKQNEMNVYNRVEAETENLARALGNPLHVVKDKLQTGLENAYEKNEVIETPSILGSLFGNITKSVNQWVDDVKQKATEIVVDRATSYLMKVDKELIEKESPDKKGSKENDDSAFAKRMARYRLELGAIDEIPVAIDTTQLILDGKVQFDQQGDGFDNNNKKPMKPSSTPTLDRIGESIRDNFNLAVRRALSNYHSDKQLDERDADVRLNRLPQSQQDDQDESPSLLQALGFVSPEDSSTPRLYNLHDPYTRVFTPRPQTVDNFRDYKDEDYYPLLSQNFYQPEWRIIRTLFLAKPLSQNEKVLAPRMFGGVDYDPDLALKLKMGKRLLYHDRKLPNDPPELNEIGDDYLQSSTLWQREQQRKDRERKGKGAVPPYGLFDKKRDSFYYDQRRFGDTDDDHEDEINHFDYHNAARERHEALQEYRKNKRL